VIPPGRWLPADGLSLEPNALTAAREETKNLALTAGPGAGKTEMLAQRRILAISAKVDAAQNLKARVRMRCGHDLASRLDSYTFHAFAKKLIDRFRVVLQGKDALDQDYTVGPQRIHRKVITFNDMVPLAVSIIERSSIARNAVQNTYSDVFLDEFQDCTREQYRLLLACFRGTSIRLTAVGDTKQRIMGWAGALEGIFRSYAADFAAVPLNLYQNFRSAPRLRRMQNRMVRVMDAPAAVSDEELAGETGFIEVFRFADAGEEATKLATLIRSWIDEDDLPPSEIAVLVSRQQNLYCDALRTAFGASGIPFREEDSSQDLASEPVARVIIDFLLVANGISQPDPHRRLLELLVFHHAHDDEHEYQLRSKWTRFVAQVVRRIADGKINLQDRTQLMELVVKLIGEIGRDVVVSLSPDYAHGNRLQQLIEQTVDRVLELVATDAEVEKALGSFSGDRAVKIMSIHKSKGLEFDSVILFGVENETFWGNLVDERAVYFVGISRAKRRLSGGA
jgi:superfamily I DNA/RNA helicase